MVTSSAQILKTLATEAFRANAYKDGFVNGVQMYSIGYGHQIQSNEGYLLTTAITKDKALALFRVDAHPIEDQINKTADPCNQNQFDAFWDFGFNCGVGALAKVIDTWNEDNDPAATVAHMALYNKSRVNGVLQVNSGLVDRREDEAATFLTEVTQAITNNPGTSITVLFGVVVFASMLFS